MNDALSAAVAYVELFTGTGMRSQPPSKYRKANGDLDAEAIARDARAALETPTRYRYSIRCLHSSSAKYGPCEVCKGTVDEVFHQTEELEYIEGRWTHAGCSDLFGHRECLQARRRKPHHITPRREDLDPKSCAAILLRENSTIEQAIVYARRIAGNACISNPAMSDEYSEAAAILKRIEETERG